MDTETGPLTEVVVVGAGYAGLMAANRLLGRLTETERDRVRVTMVNPTVDFVERIRLHELVGGSRSSVRRPLRDLLHPSVRLLEGTAELVDLDRQMLQVRNDHDVVDVPWDHLVCTVGSVAAAPIPGAREHGHLIGDLEGASNAAAAVADARPGGRVVVVGGGLTGIEVASETAEQNPHLEVTMICAGELAPGMRSAARRDIRRTLERLGVRIVEQRVVVTIEERRLELEDGGVEHFDVCLVAASFDVPELAARSGLTVDPAGRLRVDAMLRSVDHPRIWGAGDAVAPPESVGGHLRMSCAVALPTGAHAADNLARTLRAQPAQPLSTGFLVQCLALGRRSGYIQVVRADDTPRAMHVGGRLAAFVKEKICTLVVNTPAREAQRAGTYRWPQGPRVARRGDAA